MFKLFWEHASNESVALNLAHALIAVNSNVFMAKLNDESYGKAIAREFDELSNRQKYKISNMQADLVMLAILKLCIERNNADLRKLVLQLRDDLQKNGFITSGNSFFELIKWLESRGVVF